MEARAKGVVMGTGGVFAGLFAGLFASQIVSWNSVAKGLLGAGVALLVSMLLLWLLPAPKPNQRV